MGSDDRLKRAFSRPRGLVLGAFVAVAMLAIPALAAAHLERPSYWPDPAPDTSIKPAAGGEVPEARSLSSAVSGKGAGQVRVVCKGKGGKKSLKLAKQSISKAREKGFRLRPSQPATAFSKKKAKEYRTMNEAFASKCRFDSVQDAIDASVTLNRVLDE